jgi:tRNA threonylcarbamoyladenosine biosynthesis protein TsaB
VGLAAIKALAEILQKPIVTVSLLEVVAVAIGSDGRVIAMLDAGRGEVYAGTYDIQNAHARCVSELVLSAADLASEFAGARLVTADEKLASVLTQKGMRIQQVAAPAADDIARIGFEKLQRGETVSPEALDATYIRRSEAEIKFAERTR